MLFLHLLTLKLIILNKQFDKMKKTLQDQSVALLGRAGSGKSTNFCHVVSYLALAGGESSILSLDKYCFF